PGRAQEVQAENVTVLEGGTAEITCHLHRYDGSIVVIQNPARQTLFFNGTRALKDERFELAEFSRRRLRLRLARARLEDEGGYSCQLYADDTQHQLATLTVLVPPEPPLVEAGALAVEGEELELTCLVPRARPLATLRWYRDRRELPGRSSHGQEGKVFWQRSVLHLRVERRDHGAIVTCEATHPALGRGQRRQTQYQLDVQYPPSARIHPSQSVLREGDTLVLTCAINGNPRCDTPGTHLSTPGTHLSPHLSVSPPADPGAVVAAQGAGPFAVVGGALALLVFLLLLLLGALVWCSVRQKG
ncbi:CADM4 protein, partial [Dicaeum eximium]|nr:CADM4 protein [Dicaeum eximium]